MIEIEKVRARLEDRLGKLTADTREIATELRQPGDPDFEERAVEIESEEVLESLGKVASAEIEQIEAALGRIENGTYGVCVECGEEIADARLEAMPYAARCINCSD